MTMIKLMLMVGVGVLVSACSSSIEDGGPCDYEILKDNATVITVTDAMVVLSGAEMYEVPVTRFETPPVLDDRYTVVAQHITMGSCSPIAVQSVVKLPMEEK